MAKKKNKMLWDGIYDDAFYNEDNIDILDMAEYDLEKMKIFSANINYFRQIIRLSDSLKPVERRILYSMYLMGALPKTKTRKCNEIIGNTMKIHAHGDQTIYGTLVNMVQPWKKPVPLVRGVGNFANIITPDLYAQVRYTEAKLSEYAYECFFEDFDEDCVEIINNTASDGYEPASLPSKFPNIIINGGMGIAIGNIFRIPPYNINDIISLTKKLLQDPEFPDIYIAPDLPTGCDIVDKNDSIKTICDTGMGTLYMRSNIEIEETPKNWVLRVTTIPWMVSLTDIDKKLRELTKAHILPIKNIHNDPKHYEDEHGNIATEIDYSIIIDKAHDPALIKQKLYKLTDLEKSVAINFKVVLEGLSLEKMNMRDLILSWIDSRREYKRRLYNKKINKITARIDILTILIDLTGSDKLMKTVEVIRNSDNSEVIEKLMKMADMNSHQAKAIADMKLRAFTKDTHIAYIEEKAKLEETLKNIYDIITSEKKIDRIILEELNDLKKYASPRRSRVIADDGSNIAITNSYHMLIVTNQGLIKKVPYDPDVKKMPTLGSFKTGDYPIKFITAKNMDNITFFDSYGKFSTIPVHTIASTENSNCGTPLYDYTKLNGTIVAAYSEFISSDKTKEFIMDKLNDEIRITTLTSKSYAKSTDIDEFTKTKGVRNIRFMKIKNDDSMIAADLILKKSRLIIYSEQGCFSYISAEDIPYGGKDISGLQTMKLEDTDKCAGMSVVGKDDTHLVIITEKGLMKKCDITFLGTPGKRYSMSYIATVNPGDRIIYVDSINEESVVQVSTKGGYQKFKFNDIPELGRKAKGQKMVSLPVGMNIIQVDIIRKGE